MSVERVEHAPQTYGTSSNINATREPGKAELRHDSFMAKVPSVVRDAPKFIGTQNYGNGNTRNVYNFPRKQAMQMAMSAAGARKTR